ncbi:MAG: molybdate ABC transporter substrate-binding protein [Caldilineaceae bacterium]|nr:molybdate ABC transporter substrate-binding protein [Caldilineaceae bacterium]
MVWWVAAPGLIGCVGISGPASQPVPTELVIFAASSLTEAFTALGQGFEADHPTVGVTLNFAGSQQLAQQLALGAPADLFASADQAQMAAVITAGRVSAESVQIFAHNRLVIVLPGDNPGNVHALADLARPGLRVVLADATVPVGAYTRTFLANAAAAPDLPAAFSQGVLANTVSFEINVRAVLSKVRLGEADAGVVYASDGAAAGTTVQQIPIPDALNVVAAYPLAPVTDSHHPQEAAAFMAYILGPAGQAILANHGF